MARIFSMPETSEESWTENRGISINSYCEKLKNDIRYRLQETERRFNEKEESEQITIHQRVILSIYMLCLELISFHQ
jgi:hypothetical protein